MASIPTYTTVNNNTHKSWWRDAGLRRLMFWQSCILLSQMSVGYDESVIGSFQAMQPWLNAMDNPSAQDVGLITVSLFLGGLVAAFFASPVADRFGRRMALLIGSILFLIGSGIQAGAQSKGMFIGARVLIGCGVSFTTSSGPSLLNELAHPRMRGRVASSFNALWYVGSILSAWISFGSGHLDDSWAWRIPSLVQGVPALLQLASVVFMPESPRYLCSRGRHLEAKSILARYHANGAAEDDLVDLEMTQITNALDAETAGKRVSWGRVLRNRANRQRLAICVAVALLTLWNGQGVISYYFSPILTSIGITSTNQQTGINGGMQIWNLICSLSGMWLAEIIGRRSLWLTSFIGMVIANVPLTIASARYAEAGSDGAAYAVVVFLFLYNGAFNLGCNPLPYAYTTEILPYAIRTKGLAVFIVVSDAALTVNQYVNPIALDRIGFWYFVLYLGLLLIGTGIIYLFFPETKGYTLEELSMLFEDEEARGGEVLEGVVVEEAAVKDGEDGSAAGSKDKAVVQQEAVVVDERA